MILSSDASPDDKKYVSETSTNMNVRNTASPTSTSKDVSISRSSIPSINKILVTHDGKDSSNKAVNYAISLSNMSGAEIVLLRVIENSDKIEWTSVSVEGSHNANDNSLKRNVQGPFVDAMEDTIRKCREAGSKNKISYKFRTGNLVSEIADEVKAQGYDMLVLTSSHIDSWIKSLFSDTRKIISNVTIPVLVLEAWLKTSINTIYFIA
jgi:nucleotide-binding universal stress UspA family protein